MKERDDIVGRHLFDVFPENPEAPSGAVANTRASMLRVLENREPDVMPVQRHDVVEFEGGAFVEKYWSPVNAPVLDDANFDKEWRRAFREHSSIGLILIDVDFFKTFNDAHGHQAGDECLRQIAQALSNQAGRPTDTVARYGGEEFAVLLSGGTQDAIALAERMRAAVETLALPHGSSEIANVVTISVGVAALVPSQQRQLQTLVKAADEALYQAKAKGRNRVEAARSRQQESYAAGKSG